MCLAVPGKIVEIYHAQGLRMARIDFGGVLREACLEYLPEAKVGDYANVHVGFGISLVDEAEALATLETYRAIASVAAQDDQP